MAAIRVASFGRWDLAHHGVICRNVMDPTLAAIVASAAGGELAYGAGSWTRLLPLTMPESKIIDSSIVRVPQHGACACGAAKRGNETKLTSNEMRRKVIQIRSLTRRGAVLAASAIATAALYSTPIAVQAQSKNVKIAIIVPLSGPWARQGTLVKFGAETAIDEINAAGGINGALIPLGTL